MINNIDENKLSLADACYILGFSSERGLRRAAVVSRHSMITEKLELSAENNNTDTSQIAKINDQFVKLDDALDVLLNYCSEQDALKYGEEYSETELVQQKAIDFSDEHLKNFIADTIDDFDWSPMAVRSSEYELNMINAMLEKEQTQMVLKGLGDYYLLCREQMQMFGAPLVNTTKIPFVNPDTKKLKKATILVLENSKKMVLKEFDTIKTALFGNVKTFSKLNQNSFVMPHVALRSEYVEFKGIGLLYILWFLCDYSEQICQPTLTKTQNKLKMSFVVSTILMAKKFINHYKNTSFKSILPSQDVKISAYLFDDLFSALVKLGTFYNLDNMESFEYCPELIISNSYGQYSNLMSIKLSPFDHQLELINQAKNCFNGGFLTIVDSIIGSGKTTTIVMLAKLVEKLKDETNNHNLSILFVSPSEGVRNQVGCLCWNAGINFGVVVNKKIKYIDIHGNVKNITHKFAVDHPRCEKYTLSSTTKKCAQIKGKYTTNSEIFTNKLVTITDQNSAISFLNNLTENELNNNIVVFDDPLIDTQEHLRETVSLIKSLPARSIIMSGTFPKPEKIPQITEYFKSKYPDLKVNSVNTNHISVSCRVEDYTNNKIFLPHFGAKCSQDILNVIANINKFPFLGKLCDHNVFRHLFNQMKLLSIDSAKSQIESIIQIFSDVNNLTPNMVKITYLELLNILSQQPNDIIEQVCLMECIRPDKHVNMQDLCKAFAHNLMGPTIIASINVVDTALDKFGSLLNDINSHKFQVKTVGSESGKSGYEPYYFNYESFENMTKISEKINKSLEKRGADPLNLPAECKSIYFSAKHQINTQHHFEYYTKTSNDNLKFRLPLQLNTINFSKTRVDGKILSLLCAGVGLYSITDSRLDVPYLNIVFELALQGKLAYIIADKSIIYGISMPVNHVIVMEDFAQQCNIFELVQLFGRAGRLGKSDFAICYVGPTCVEKLSNLTKGNDDGESEVAKLLAAFDKC